MVRSGLGFAILAILAMGVLISCQSLSKAQCQSVDWQELGQRDGASGEHPQTRLENHITACQRAGISVDQIAWRQGYDAGLTSFCTPTNAFDLGRKGRPYFGQCPVSDDGSIRAAHALGIRSRNVEQEITGLENAIADAEYRVGQIPGKVADKTLGAEEGRRQIERLQWEIRDDYAKLEIARRQLDTVRLEARRFLQGFTTQLR